MKKAYNYIEIELEKFEDVIVTSGEYLETDKTSIGVKNADSSSFNFMNNVYDNGRYNVT